MRRNTANVPQLNLDTGVSAAAAAECGSIGGDQSTANDLLNEETAISRQHCKTCIYFFQSERLVT